MILTCPSCGTQYVVKDGAIPEGGRKVRCASCRHSWHQDPEPAELEEPVRPLEPVEPEEPEEPVEPIEPEEPARPGEPAGQDGLVEHDEAAWDEPPATGDEPEAATVYRAADPVDELARERAALAPAGTMPQPAPSDDPASAADDDFSPFAAREPVERKHRGPVIAMLVIFILVAALAAGFWFLAPTEWRSRVGLAEAGQTPLQLMMTHSDRQALASGNELLAVSGRVINPTSKAQSVPPIQAVLRSKTGEVVYRWTIAPPAATLAPGASARFNSAEVNVPAGGEELTVSLGAPGA